MWCNNDSSVRGDIPAVKKHPDWVESNFEIIFQDWFWHWFKWKNKDLRVSHPTTPSSLCVGVWGPGNHGKRAAESLWPLRWRKPCVLRRRQLSQPCETPERDARLNSSLTGADFAPRHRSCCQTLKILPLQAVLGWQRLTPLCEHADARAAGLDAWM